MQESIEVEGWLAYYFQGRMNTLIVGPHAPPPNHLLSSDHPVVAVLALSITA